jgi:hypothetical protein
VASSTNRRALPFGLMAFGTATSLSLSWLCCVPLFAGLLGAGAAGLGTRLEPWRPVLSGVSLLLLAAGFYFAYRRETCDEKDGCSVRSRRLPRVLLWISAVLTVLLLTLPIWSNWLIYWTS